MAIISDKTEQASLRHSGRILASCLWQLEKKLKPGIKASELNQLALDFIQSHQASAPFLGYMGFPHALCTSINQEVVHGLSDENKTIQEGDLVSLDLGVNFQGMITDAARTFLLGPEGVVALTKYQNQIDLVNTSKIFSANQQTADESTKALLLLRTDKALQLAVSSIKAGRRIGDIGHSIHSFVSQFGYGNVSALGGHGVGREVHEPPYIANQAKKSTGGLIVENMVLAIEPMITLGSGRVKFTPDEKYGWEVVVTSDLALAAHFEDTILVHKDGCEVLTRLPETEILK